MAFEQLEQHLNGAILVGETGVLAMNEKARTMFPGLVPGAPLPQWLELPGEENWEGCAAVDGRPFRLIRTRTDEGCLYSLTPGEQYALTQEQLSGTLYQLRSLMSQLRCQLAPTVGDRAELTAEGKDALARSQDQMLRLMDHLDFLRDTPKVKVPEVVELGEFCGHVALECDGLLGELGIRVEFTGLPEPLYVRGDREMLREALTELVSNCAKRLKQGGAVSLKLTRRGGKGVIQVTDDGPAAARWERLSLTTRGAAPLIPKPGMGAGLGLSVVEGTALSHGGSVLYVPGDVVKVYLVLPETRDLGGVGVKCTKIERNAGRNPYIIALSDVLPGSIIREDWKE